MKTPTLRGYVWMFCMYLACTVNILTHTGGTIKPPHLKRSFFFTLYPDVIVPAFLIFVFLSVLPTFKNGVMRAVLILSAFAFASDVVFALHQYEYITFGTPHWLFGWSWVIATCFLGYRIDQLLKESNRVIEAN